MEIRPIADLRKTKEISKFCKETQEPIFITKNGYGELVVMDIETYNQLKAAAGIPQQPEEIDLAKRTGRND